MVILGLVSFPQHNNFETHNIFSCINSSIALMDVSQFVHPFTCRWILGLFLFFLAFTNKAATNMCVKDFVCTCAFIFLW